MALEDALKLGVHEIKINLIKKKGEHITFASILGETYPVNCGREILSC